MKQLLTKKDLIERWQLSSGTIDNYLKDGILAPVKGTKLDRFSPIERKRLENELEEWKTRAEKAEAVLSKFEMIIAQFKFNKDAFKV